LTEANSLIYKIQFIFNSGCLAITLNNKADMNIALTLFKYFPFGGLQRDMAAIACELINRGHQVTVLTTEWQGTPLSDVMLEPIRNKGITNHARMAAYSSHINKIRQQNRFDIIVGFNKCAGLDMHYVADVCWRNKLHRQWFKQLLPRYRTYLDLETQTFNNPSCTFLFISAKEIENYRRFYAVAENQAILLPPGINLKFIRPHNADEIREKFRKEFGLADKDKTCLFVGSGFKTKGLDRAIRAFSTLPGNNKRFFVIGRDNPAPYQKLAGHLGVADQIFFLGGRDDVQRFYLGCDVLLHPARFENTGTVLLEAALSGLYVITTTACGYADHIKAMACGEVIAEPVQQQSLNQAVMRISRVNYDEIDKYRQQQDFHGLFKTAANVIEGAR
jgi:UDP-glucose:(heptosyl)LPS alpha-1,3-glucosyltransferase